MGTSDQPAFCFVCVAMQSVDRWRYCVCGDETRTKVVIFY